MKKLIILFILFFQSSSLLWSKSTIKLGVGETTFRHESGESKYGLCFGFGKQFYPLPWFDGYLGIDINYSRKAFLLKDKIWAGGMYVDDSFYSKGNITADVSYLEFPVMVGYSLELFGKTRIQIFAGYSFSLPFSNNTTISKTQTVYVGPGELQKIDIDYKHIIDAHPSTSTNTYWGTRFLVYNNIFFNFEKIRALTPSDGYTNLSITDRVDTYQFSLLYLF